ncbi:MAG: type II toxin-antitoxin system prevent-host-death family antitoxin [Candidatus Marinimicrobia bacterium]|nr:type II toxin-antitoxin system prevent-host-death family antitoxin [Candidatus Neomarinimicrobiota bacterium]
MQATAKDLRFHSKELLESVDRGEEVIITYRGKPRAKLIPFHNEKTGFDEEENQLFGIWKDNDFVQNVDEYVREIRKGRY